MQAKGLIKFFAIAIIVVCVYQLVFTWKSFRIEAKAEAYAQEQVDKINTDLPPDSVRELLRYHNARFLDSLSGEEVLNLGIKKYTYNEVKALQLNLGLDLQGGMSVVLQVSLEELIRGMADNSQDPTFLAAIEKAKEMQKESQEDLVTLFGLAWNEIDPNAQMASIFATLENKDLFNQNSTNQEILAELKRQSEGAITRTYNILRTRIDRFGVTQPNISLQEGSGRIIVELPGVDNPDRVRKLLQSTAQLEFWTTFENTEIINLLLEANDILRQSMAMDEELAGDTTSTDTGDDIMSMFDEEDSDSPNDTSGVAVTDSTDDDFPFFGNDTSGTTADSDTSSMLSDEEFNKQNPLRRYLSLNIYQDATGQYQPGPGAIVGYAYGRDIDKVNEMLSSEEVELVFPSNIKFLWGAKPINDEGVFALYAIRKNLNDDEPQLDGDAVIDARQEVSQQNGNPNVSMTMNTEGALQWKILTGENIGKSIAVVLDNVVYSAPTVQSEISGGRSEISGSFTISEAQDLANILKAGKLPAPAQIIEEEVVGPSLGAESIRAGMYSIIGGLALVLIFMVLYYTSAGLVSDLALLLNLFFIIGVLASFGAALTLPGIAGIVLTIGMAVDANVIIYERIREELMKGKGLRLAVVDGYKHSYSAIVDANLTSLITGFILLYFGLGPVKGFATVFVIGIFSSFFTAVLLSRVIFDWRLANNPEGVAFWSKMTEGAFKDINIDFISKRKVAYMISGIIIVIGIGSFILRGFETGVDFKGGRTYVVRFDQNVSTTDMVLALEDVMGVQPVVKTFGGDNQVKITTSYLIEENSQEADSIVDRTVYEGVKQFFVDDPGYEGYSVNNKMSSMKVGPTIADDIKSQALIAAIFSLLGIFFYILFRFRRWQFSLGAIAALFHDVLVVLAVFSLFNGILPFSLEIDQAFIAAILTIIGYSINDTVVVFDRVREYLTIHTTTDLKTTINMAINSTLSRTVLTAVTTLLVVVILAIFGGEVIRGFSFALLIGVFVGTYSSIFIATPMALDLIKEEDKKK